VTRGGSRRAAVSVVLTEGVSQFRARDDLGNSRVFARFQGEPEDRFSGRRRSPQQTVLNPPPGTNNYHNPHFQLAIVIGKEMRYDECIQKHEVPIQ